mgnify:CR=1 FL=1
MSIMKKLMGASEVFSKIEQDIKSLKVIYRDTIAINYNLIDAL